MYGCTVGFAGSSVGNTSGTASPGKLIVPTYVSGVAAAPLLQQELPDGAWEITTGLALDPAERFQQAGLLLHASDPLLQAPSRSRATSSDTVEFVYRSDGSNRMGPLCFAVGCP